MIIWKISKVFMTPLKPSLQRMYSGTWWDLDLCVVSKPCFKIMNIYTVILLGPFWPLRAVLASFKILNHSSKFVRKKREKVFRSCLSDVDSRFHNATRAHSGMKYRITSVILCSVVSIKYLLLNIKYFYGCEETLDFFINFAIQITFDSIKDLFDFQVRIINVFNGETNQERLNLL